MDRQEDVIRRITAHVVAYRFQLENERHESRKNMAIEIKGLKADALTARANLDKIRAAYAKFNEAAPAHAADVDGLAASITGMQSDLEFAATVMGNSDGASGVSQRPPVVPKVAPEVTDRVALGPHPDQPEGADVAIVKPILGIAANQYADAVAQLNKSTDRDIAEVAKGPAPTFRAAE